MRFGILAAGMCLVAAVDAAAQISFWNNSVTPGRLENANDTRAVTVGLRFYSEVSGTVTGIRFYKGPNNRGTHVGHLWSNDGASLGSVTFTGETVSGWQQANFASPVNISKFVIYSVSYFAPQGAYASDQNFPWYELSAAPIRVMGASPGGLVYGVSPAFPAGGWGRTNYYVDVVFVPAGTTPGPTTHTISGNVQGSSATLTLAGQAAATTATDAAGNYRFAGLRNGTYAVVPSRRGYVFTPSTASVVINGNSRADLNFRGAVVTAPRSRSVSLTWIASTSPGVRGYNVYRASISGGAYEKLNASPVAGTSYIDQNVISGRTYYYVATAVNGSNVESDHSNVTIAPVPAS
jgi:hypothetical protein